MKMRRPKRPLWHMQLHNQLAGRELHTSPEHALKGDCVQAPAAEQGDGGIRKQQGQACFPVDNGSTQIAAQGDSALIGMVCNSSACQGKKRE
ncbi:hypothetical protein SDC9_93790 [bioreactor metagenome]|uniref:Uncharacterized protein n=1 Tax=bioreactor metagenome TaxID=1076179 RepID=A0A645A221_9ZZZZ